ncbi:MFS general substrate transporter [Laetiporus sulphureus 93-53]|uniref:MFS general substrate transporter n=1 Tax=Laetiporus sulphureus 93-53 TaxID=1314785 RepID=A0A165HBN9_9APHY|nr:MFS general substrate transporter [Laetiporus sulphureus 93-53]KZT11514.1 MFS general substrate transporter [Laetiporus sulphureus 93-53]
MNASLFVSPEVLAASVTVKPRSTGSHGRRTPSRRYRATSAGAQGSDAIDLITSSLFTMMSESQNSSLNDVEAAREKRYPGSGTLEDPYVVDWDQGDPENPFNWKKSKKWVITIQLAYATWVAAFCSSAYSGGITYTVKELHVSKEVALLGVSLYVLGFFVGPLFWAPLSEMYGRRIVFICTFFVFMLLHIGGALCKNIATLLATRVLAGMFGVSPFSNSGAALADIWTARERGVAASLYASAPFMGPVIGPLVGGWISMSRVGWHFNFWIMFILSGIGLLGFIFIVPETYAPVLLRWRARKLRRASEGRVRYISKFDLTRGTNRIANFKTNMKRPFIFLFAEPIVTLFAIYVSIAYAILYAFFASYPIVFEEQRGWSPGLDGLAFIGVGVGTTLGMCLSPVQNRLYWRAMAQSPTGVAPPEARLYGPMLGGLCLPIGLWWFAWTSEPRYLWILPVIAGGFFGMGVALIIQGVTQYLMDAYRMYGASAIAATVVLRSICAAIFPEVVPIMYQRLGDGWACTVFAFLVTACMPLPFLFFKYGAWVRRHSKWALQDSVPPPAPAPMKPVPIVPEHAISEKPAQSSA